MVDNNSEKVSAEKNFDELPAEDDDKELWINKEMDEFLDDRNPDEFLLDSAFEKISADDDTEGALIDDKPKEHYVRRGDPNKPTYYIIRRLPDTTGLLARYRMIMGHVRYALSNNWIPVVDMQNYPNPYLDPEKLGKENSWEYYFEQPLRIGLAEAYSGENIILSDGDAVKPYPGHSLKFLEKRNDDLSEWRMLIKLGLIKMKPQLEEEISATWAKLFSPEDRVLGVILRGTDYIARKIKGRPIPPPVDFAKSIVNAKLKDWKCNKFFLATEDKRILEAFQHSFGYRCVILDREYVEFNSLKDKVVSTCRIERENDYYLQGKEYLTQIWLLSMCNALVAARCSGTTTAMMLDNKFEQTYFFNVGRYGQMTLD